MEVNSKKANNSSQQDIKIILVSLLALAEVPALTHIALEMSWPGTKLIMNLEFALSGEG